mgnify:CR=1 FL=1
MKCLKSVGDTLLLLVVFFNSYTNPANDFARLPPHRLVGFTCDLYRLLRKYDSRSPGICAIHWIMEFMKHVFPRFRRPVRPFAGSDDVEA